MSVPAEPTIAEVAPKVDANKPARQGLLAVGGILGALASASCCIVPLVLFSLGVSGAWIGNLAALSLYQSFFRSDPTAGFPGARDSVTPML